ncbi:alpha-hydroxy acid oxidase [Arthrobacter globiformis]|uniref:Alpha-hydroxy-acid oxidizing enzyme n=1 Tax=Arthrobacter globiformis TaxID=1665 RepID=A0A328HI91_ARTGO|nr:alpha-hydroxy acid oxidase [Arthrobacter globiformis]RAM38338.1 alpha-hydroxy-acid oxidizing enzyme [Arthrobacter globiformis]
MVSLKRQVPKVKDFAPLLKFKMPEANATARRLSNAHTIADLRRIAKRRTPAGPFDYTDGAADHEISIERSRQAFLDVEFQPGILRDVTDVNMTTTVLGKESALPFGMAPTGFTRMMHSAGERAVASAAARAGIPYSLSTVGTTSIEEVAATAPNGRRWFQLYLWKNRDLSLELIENAAKSGYDTLIITVDVPTTGNRVRDLRNGMSIPPQLTLKTLLDASYRPEWWINFLTTEPYTFAFDREGSGSLGDLVSTLYDSSVTFEDLRWMREVWKGHLIVKGIQTVDDAERAFEHGADGIVVSNHGGRQLDRAPVPFHLLPRIVDRVGDRGTVMLDTGITSGADIVAAIALGADFTLIGRAYLYGLMAGGEAGVTRCIDILSSEIERTMALLGVTSVSELNRDHVRALTRSVPVAIA